MNKSKLLALICALTIAVCTCAFPLSVSAVSVAALSGGEEDETIEENGFTFKTNIDGGLVLYEYSVEDAEVTIPSSVKGKNVESIGARAFFNNLSLEKVTIPDTVKRIEDGAFAYSWLLSDVVIPSSVEYVAKNAFSDTAFLKYNSDRLLVVGKGLLIDCKATEDHIVVPDNVNKIMNYAFSGNETMTSIDLGNKITSIEKGAFLDCTALKEVVIPPSVKSIGICAFEGCTSLKRLVIPDSVETLGEDVFDGCTALTVECRPNTPAAEAASEASVPVVINWYGDDRDYSNLTFSELEDGTLCLDSVSSLSGSELVIPAEYHGKKVTKISSVSGYGSYSLNHGLEKITLPDTITEVGNSCFYWLSALREINIPKGATGFENAFYMCPSMTSFTVANDDTNYSFKNGLLTTKDGAVLIRFTKTDVTEYTVPETVTSISDNAFAGLEKLTKLTIPPSVKEIESRAVLYNTNNVTIYCYPGTEAKSFALDYNFSYVVLSYGDDRDYDDLTFAELPDGTLAVTGTKSYAEESLTIPETYNGKRITRIGSYAFANTHLSGITIANGVEIIERGAFKNCALKTVTIPGSVKEIYWFSFYGCTELKSVELGEGTKIIGRAAFKGCPKLESVYAPDSADVFGKYVFDNCPLLTVYCSKGSAVRAYAGSSGVKAAAKEEYQAKKETTEPSGANSPVSGEGSSQALYTLRVSIGLEQPAEGETRFLDVDGDGSITTNDALEALKLSTVIR